MFMPIIRESPKHETSFVTISKDEFESMQATIEVLSDEDLMRQIRESRKDVEEGRFIKWDDFVKERLSKKKKK